MADLRSRSDEVAPTAVRSRAPGELDHGRRRVVIEAVTPSVDGGKFAAKRTVGERVVVEADVFADGHDLLGAAVLVRVPGEDQPREVPLEALPNDRWQGSFTVDRIGRWRFRVVGWVDHLETWRQGTLKKVAAGQDVAVELLIGAAFLEEVVQSAGPTSPGGQAMAELAAELRAAGSTAPARIVTLLGDRRLVEVAPSLAPRHHASTSDEFPIVVDPPLARCSAWYELFPRSASDDPDRHGTFDDVIARLPYVAQMGFDVLYLPPIHPIGTAFRKGPNNAVQAEPGDLGSPWGIGDAEGGHDAIHPALGTEADLRRLLGEAKALGIEVALDIAFQCSPDHPWVRAHPTWFRARPDGTIQYAENPPKKYQDIYPIDFETPDWQELWSALHGVFEHWITAGITLFRVDNPHTKAFPFWEWVITTLKADHPEVLFLAEAFTRPKVMHRLAKVGFSQSYTYFAWRDSGPELREYFEELAHDPSREYFRPNVWPNTPDILTEHLQQGGRPAFVNRVVLAATLAASYGIYGPAYELGEHVPREPGSEEYLDSEKYQRRVWDLDRADSLAPLITRLNEIRKAHPALHHDWSLWFHQTDNPTLLAYSKVDDERGDVILTIASTDPYATQAGWVTLDLAALGLQPGPYELDDLLSGGRYTWDGPTGFVQLDPWGTPAHLFHVTQAAATSVAEEAG